VPFYLKYSGAHTHRWSGGDKMNPQNFNRGGALRAAILAPPGHKLAVADSGQIEARKVAWVARQESLLQTFRRNDAQTARWQAAREPRCAELLRKLGRELTEAEEEGIDRELAAQGIEEGDFYSDAGSQFFRKRLSKRETKRERQIAKALLLGLGFGMGWGKCATELLKGMLGTPPVQFTAAHAAEFGVDVAAFEDRHHGMRLGDRPPPTCGRRCRS
jgi:DNA polymerase